MSTLLGSRQDTWLSDDLCLGESLSFSDEAHSIDIPIERHSCSYHKFFSKVSSSQIPYATITNLISEYYTPQQNMPGCIHDFITTTFPPSIVRCNSIPIPSYNLSVDDHIKQMPALCPFLSQHLVLEFLFWLLVILFFNMGHSDSSSPNFGSFAVLIVFYGLIQAMIVCMGIFYKNGIYRYEHIENVPVHNTKERVSYFERIFNIAPSVSLSMELYESSTANMNKMEYDKVTKDVFVNECAVFIEPDIGKESEEWNDFLYVIEYENDFDFVGSDQRTKFEEICAKFIKSNGKNNCFHSFDVNVEHKWCGHIVIINSSSKWSVYCVRAFIRLLNALCLSVLYKFPLYFVKRKKFKISKFCGFEA